MANKMSAQALSELLGADGVEKLKVLLSGVGSDVPSGVSSQSAQDSGVKLRRVSSVADTATTASSESWADMMEQEGVSVVGVPTISQDVRSRVVFGGFGAAPSGGTQSPKSTGGMAQYVRTDSARRMRALLAQCGIKLPKASAWHIAMVTYTAATMPQFFRDGKDLLRNFAVLGDAALTAAVAAVSISSGRRLDSTQSVRSTLLSDAHMRRCFADSEFVSCVSLGTNIDPATAKTGATALEAIFGVVAFYRSPADVIALAQYLQLIE